ncbi:MAG: DNA-directed RNA polymerase subunit K [Candidatus Aenigmarchaeota archaeon]|nr:DNA-directed RNA polymerase subunit K [Candidatus Aenigmarchaeota archaeon]
MFFYSDLTRFEKTRIVSARALQISMGAPVLIKTDRYDPIEIAKLELEKDILPITVKRSMPKKLK